MLKKNFFLIPPPYDLEIIIDPLAKSHSGHHQFLSTLCICLTFFLCFPLVVHHRPAAGYLNVFIISLSFSANLSQPEPVDNMVLLPFPSDITFFFLPHQKIGSNKNLQSCLHSGCLVGPAHVDLSCRFEKPPLFYQDALFQKIELRD